MYENQKKSKLPLIIGISIGVIFLLITLFTVVLVVGISSTIKNSEAYKSSIAEIESSYEVKEEIGEIVGYGFMPSGSVSTSNGQGESALTIRVKGEEDTIKVYCEGEKEPGEEWQIVKFKILE